MFCTRIHANIHNINTINVFFFSPLEDSNESYLIQNMLKDQVYRMLEHGQILRAEK